MFIANLNNRAAISGKSVILAKVHEQPDELINHKSMRTNNVSIISYIGTVSFIGGGTGVPG